MQFSKKQLNQKFNHQVGFTLIEIIVSTAIFVTVVSAMLVLFNYTLQINRRVQALREVVQGTRNFTETITREIRNGRIDYSSWTPECDATNYTQTVNQSLAILTKSGDKLCFYFDGNDQLSIKKQTPTGETFATIFNSTKFGVTKSIFSFTVRPMTDPNQLDPNTKQYPQIQPFVIISARFTLNDGSNKPTTIDYQTTISTDAYDILK